MVNPSIGLIEYLRNVGADEGVDFLREAVRQVVQEVMELEVQEKTGAGKHERSAARVNRRNGYRERDWETRVGKVALPIPKLSLAAPWT